MSHYAAGFTRLLGPGGGPGRRVDARAVNLTQESIWPRLDSRGLTDSTKRSSESDFDSGGPSIIALQGKPPPTRKEKSTFAHRVAMHLEGKICFDCLPWRVP